MFVSRLNGTSVVLVIDAQAKYIIVSSYLNKVRLGYKAPKDLDKHLSKSLSKLKHFRCQ